MHFLFILLSLCTQTHHLVDCIQARITNWEVRFSCACCFERGMGSNWLMAFTSGSNPVCSPKLTSQELRESSENCLLSKVNTLNGKPLPLRFLMIGWKSFHLLMFPHVVIGSMFFQQLKPSWTSRMDNQVHQAAQSSEVIYFSIVFLWKKKVYHERVCGKASSLCLFTFQNYGNVSWQKSYSSSQPEFRSGVQLNVYY